MAGIAHTVDGTHDRGVEAGLEHRGARRVGAASATTGILTLYALIEQVAIRSPISRISSARRVSIRGPTPACWPPLVSR